MIIGIALVVDELHKGQRLVYRYPESVPSSVLNSTAGLLKFHQDYQSLSPDNFAKLFRPKASLFNKILELTIDDLHYISFPCPCSDELSTDTTIQTATDVITLFNVVIATVRESAIKKLDLTSLANSKRSKNYSQVQRSLSKFETAGSDPVAAALGLQNSNQAVRPRVLRRIVETISRALLNQEKRNRYVSRQVALMLRLQEDTVQQSSNLQLSSSSKHQSEFLVGNNTSINESNNNNAILKKNATFVTNNLLNDSNSGVKKKLFKPVETVANPVTNLNLSISQVSDLNSLTPPLSSRGPLGNDNGNGNNICNVSNNIVNSNSNNYFINSNDNNNNSNLLLPTNNAIMSSTTSSPGVGNIYPIGNWTVSPQRDVSPPALMNGETINSNSSALSYINSNINSNTNSMTSIPYALVTDKELLSRTISNTTTMTSLSTVNPAVINSNTPNASSGLINSISSYEHAHVQQRPVFDRKLETMESMQQQSSLANELRLIYHGLIGGHSVNLMINNVLAINIKLSDDESLIENHCDKNISTNIEGGDINQFSLERENRNRLGHLTMLTIADKDELLELLNTIKYNASSNSNSQSILSSSFSPVQKLSDVQNLNENLKKSSNISSVEQVLTSQKKSISNEINLNKSNISEKMSSIDNRYSNNSLNTRRGGDLQYDRAAIHPDLRELIESFDPTLSIEELSIILELPLSEDWGLGRLIPTITSNRRYRIHPMAPTTFDSRVAKTFSSVFHEQIRSVAEYLNLEESKRIEKIRKDHEQNQILKELNLSEEKQKNNDLRINNKNNLNDDNNTISNNQHDVNNETLKSITPRTSQFFHSSTSSSNFKIPSAAATSSGSLFNFSNTNNRSKNEIDMKNSIQNRNAVSDSNNNNNNDHGNPPYSSHSIHSIDNNNSHGIRNSTSHLQEQSNEAKPMRRSSLTISDTAGRDDKIVSINVIDSPKGLEAETVEYGFPCILAVFDGHHNLEHSIKKLPLPLHPFGVDIVVWLLRWKMIEELSTYVISLAEIEKLHPNHSLEKDAIKPLKKSKSYEELKESIRLLSTTSSFILDGDDLEHERRKSFGFLDSKHHHSHTSEYDLDMFKKLSPYFNGKFSIYEMARREGILEENILRLVKKNPNVAVFYC